MNGAKFVAVSALCVFSSAAFSQNLLQNASFEANSGGTGQGLMPTNWQATNVTPDTYTNDGSFGLAPSGFNNFTGVVAKDGIAWVAGSSSVQESFGQVLAMNLVAGQEYSLSAWLHQAWRTDLNNPGGYHVRLVTSTSNDLLGSLAPTASFADGWVSRSINFVAPTTTGAQTLVFVPYAVTGIAYPGIDDLNLQAVPEPATMAALGLGLGVLLRKRRKS